MKNNKTRRITCRFSDAEYAHLMRGVKETYMSSSDYIRRRLLVPHVNIPTKAEVDYQNYVVLALSQINNNINQIARVHNTLKFHRTIVISRLAQRQLNQVAELLHEWRQFEKQYRKTIISK